MKTLEKEIVNLENDPDIIETIINEGTQFEITSKAKINSINNFSSKAFPSETKVRE